MFNRNRDRILALLRQGPHTGAAIARETKMWTAFMYPALDRLEQGGWIVSEWRSGPYPRQRVYRLPYPDECMT